MVIVKLMGGLGNQMFQYATALRLGMKLRTSVKVDLSFLRNQNSRPGFTQRSFALDIFRGEVAIASRSELDGVYGSSRFKSICAKLTGNRFLYYRESSMAFNPGVLDLPDNSYLEGYFQSERYFSDAEHLVRHTFQIEPEPTLLSPEILALAHRVRQHHTVCLHVRRGDYVSDPSVQSFHGLCSPDYFRAALRTLRETVEVSQIFVFSDDPRWCLTEFSPADGFTVVGNEFAGAKAEMHFWLMTLANHYIISNSSYSWWAAWLGTAPGKRVLRPLRWFRSADADTSDICPVNWTSIG